MNSYYVINLTWLDEPIPGGEPGQIRKYSPELDQARALAPTEGLPNELFQCRISPDGTKAIVQADWQDIAAMDSLGINLGELQPDGSASPGVYAELTKPEWQGGDQQ